MLVILKVVALTLVLFMAQDMFRRASKWVLWGLFLVGALALTPYWLRTNEFDLFLWFKLYTVCFCVCWGTLLRFTSLGQRSSALGTIPILLAANILEATIVDASGSGWIHSLNAAAGVLLIAALPYGSKEVTIDIASCNRDLSFGISRGWVLGYSIWNWTFVYINYPSLSGHHTAILAAALVTALIDPRRWTQTRAFTLGLNLVMSATFYSSMVSWLDTSSWFDEQLGIIASGTALAFIAGFSFWTRLSAGQPTRVGDPVSLRLADPHRTA